MSEEAVPAEQLAEFVSRLDTTDPITDLDDLRPLADAVGDASIVGMGEATHGTREFFRLKHRILRLLVEEYDCRTFAMEVNVTGARAMDERLRDGTGDLESWLAREAGWIWNTEAVLALFEWIRSFNRDRPAHDRVRFYGFDAKVADPSANALVDYLSTADPDLPGSIADRLDALASGSLRGQIPDEESVESAESLVADLTDRFESRRAAYVDRTSAARYERAQRDLRTMEQAVAFARRKLAVDDVTEAYGLRDELMAENVERIAADADGLVALWAHNLHVMKRAGDEAWNKPATLGGELDERYGEDYYALGFALDRGTVQALPDPDTVDDVSLQGWTIGPDDGPDGRRGDGPGEPSNSASSESSTRSLIDVLAGSDDNCRFVDLVAATSDDELRPWLDDRHPVFTIGPFFHQESDFEKNYRRYRLGSELDGLIVVGASSRAVPLDDEPFA